MSVLAHEAAHLDAHALDAARLRSRIALFAGVAFGSTGHIAAVTVAAIVGQDLLGSATLAGLPGATVGSASLTLARSPRTVIRCLPPRPGPP